MAIPSQLIPKTCSAVLPLLLATQLARAQTGSNLTAHAESPEEERWSSFLPLMADEARARGHELPLPFGVSAIYNHIERDIKVNDLRIGINGASPQSVSRFVDLGSHSSVDVAISRLDAWLLPFVNVYGLFGYIHNVSDTRGTVTIPAPGPLPGSRSFNFDGQTTLDGFVGGAGITLAAGYQNYFLTADANYSLTDIGFDNNFRALVVSLRTGWHGKIAEFPTRLWVGAMYWDTENVASSTVQTPGVGLVSFEADQGPAHPWNASVGSSVVFAKHWEGFLEYGFNFEDVQIVAAGVAFRF